MRSYLRVLKHIRLLTVTAGVFLLAAPFAAAQDRGSFERKRDTSGIV